MLRSQPTAITVKPSAPTEGREPTQKLILKAANDNRGPLSYYLKKMLFILAPMSAIVFFILAWWFK